VERVSRPSIRDDRQDAGPTAIPELWRLLRFARNDTSALICFPGGRGISLLAMPETGALTVTYRQDWRLGLSRTRVFLSIV
jgi:hypothetical protein